VLVEELGGSRGSRGGREENGRKTFEGIAILINLAEQGEIDPWDVQVIGND